MENNDGGGEEQETLEGWVSALKGAINAACEGTQEVSSIPRVAGTYPIACPGCRITRNLANQMEGFFESVDRLQQGPHPPADSQTEGEDEYAVMSRRARVQLILRLTVEALRGLRADRQPSDSPDAPCPQHEALGLTLEQWQERNLDPEGCSLSETQLAQCRELAVVTQRWMGPSNFSAAFHKDIEPVFMYLEVPITNLSKAIEMELKESQLQLDGGTPTPSALSPTSASSGIRRFGSQSGTCNKCSYFSCICDMRCRRKRRRDVDSDDSAEQLVRKASKKRRRAQEKLRRGNSITNSAGIASPLTPGSSRAKSQTFSFSQSRSPGSRLEQSSMDQSSSATRTAAAPTNTNRRPSGAVSQAPSVTPSKAAKRLFSKSLLRDASAAPQSPFTPALPTSAKKKPPPKLLGEMMTCESPGARRRMQGFSETSTLTYCAPPRSVSSLTKEALSKLPGKEPLRTTPVKGGPMNPSKENTRLRQRCKVNDLSLKLPQPSGERAAPTLLEGNPFASQLQPALDLEELSTPLRAKARRKSTRKTLSQVNVVDRAVSRRFSSLGSQAQSPPTQAQEVARALSFDVVGEDFIPGSDSD